MVMMIVITAAVMVVMMMVLMSLMFVIVMVVMPLVIMTVVVLMTFMLVVVMVLVTLMPMVVVMVMPAALAVVVVSAALRADHFRQKFLLKGFTGLHCLQDLFARKLCDGSRDERSLVVKFTQQSHSFFHLLRFRLVRTAQDHRAGVLDLVAEELAEVLAVDPAFCHIDDSGKTVEFRIDLILYILHRLDHIRQLAHA